MNEHNPDSGDSAKTLFCFNCLMQFETEEEAHEHWADKCKHGGHLAPINAIIRPIGELPKRKEQIKKLKARTGRKRVW